MSSSLSASDRSAGPILAAHPQVRDIPIRVFFFMKNMVDFLPAHAPPAGIKAGTACLFHWSIYNDEPLRKANQIYR
jgi:hypothetical protein